MKNFILHENVSPILHHWMELGLVILVDLREPVEYKDGVLPSAVFQPMSQFEPGCLPPDPHKRTVFYCHGGRRSHAAAIKWAENWEINEAYHLKGGIASWKKYHYSTKMQPN